MHAVFKALFVNHVALKPRVFWAKVFKFLKLLSFFLMKWYNKTTVEHKNTT